MKKLAQFLLSYRLRALLRKEFAQIRRDRRLAMSLIIPPTLQLLLFSLVLNATVSNLKLGIIDDSRTPESRGLTSTLTESKSFKLAGYYYSVDKLGDAISRGDVDAGVMIPFTYAKDLQRGRPVTVQLLLNAMNANTAAIAQGYAEGVIQTYNAGLASDGLHAKFTQIAVSDVSHRGVARLIGRLSLQSRPGRLVVCRDRNIRPAADPERVHGGVYFDGEGARSRHHRTVAHVARRHL